jgi:uroporphyrinogen decarboxylase
MTARERILKTVNHELPDRIPAFLGARDEVNRGLMKYYNVNDMAGVHEILGTGGRKGVVLEIDFPGFDKRCNGKLEGDMPYAGEEYIFHDERTFEDKWGVVRRVGSDRKYVEWISGPLANACDPDEYDFPGPERIMVSPGLQETVAGLKERGYWVNCSVTQPYKTAWELVGMENLLAYYALNPGFVDKLLGRICETYGEILRIGAEAGVDVIGIGGDIAMQDRLIMGPERWRSIDKPHLARMIGACKKINPDVHVYLHSDGYLMEIMDDLIEIGFDIIDPIQPECMDPVVIKKRWGDRIVLHGCGSLQRTLPFGTPEECREEVRHLITNCGYNGGLILRVSNAIGFDVPIENVVAWFETARDFDLAELGSSS